MIFVLIPGGHMNENLFEYSDMLRSPIEAFCCGTGYWEAPVSSHWHYFLELVYVQEGSVTVSCNDNTCLLKKGAFIVFPPQAMHSIYHTDDKPYVYICCKFNLNRIKLSENYLPNLNFAFHQILNSTNPPLVFDSDNLPDFPAELFFTDILKEVQEKRYGYDACVYAQFARLIVQLLRFWLEQGISFDTDQIPEVEEEAMQNVLMYIDDHSQENINIESLARTYHMSYSYFARQFRKYYGQSCKQYIEFVRLSKVENLLLFTGHDLSYIAGETGFADCSHLIRTFKKRYQMTPKQFRLQHQNIRN